MSDPRAPHGRPAPRMHARRTTSSSFNPTALPAMHAGGLPHGRTRGGHPTTAGRPRR